MADAQICGKGSMIVCRCIWVDVCVWVNGSVPVDMADMACRYTLNTILLVELEGRKSPQGTP